METDGGEGVKTTGLEGEMLIIKDSRETVFTSIILQFSQQSPFSWQSAYYLALGELNHWTYNGHPS